MTIRASVVVPTRDRSESLVGTLRALAAQTVSHEVVVVDDGSVDRAAVEAVVASFDGVRLIRAGGDGPARARNLGASAARTDVVAFLDDDCRPVADWLSRVVARVEAGAVAVAGPTVNAEPDDRVGSAAQTVTNHLVEASLDESAGTVGFAPTSNLAVTAAVFAEVPFDESFPLAAGEDRAWCDALAERGLALAYEPDAVVRHDQTLTLARFWRQQVRYGRGGYRYHRRAAHRATGQTAAFYRSLLGKGFRQGPVTGALVVLAQLATACGIAQEAWAALRRRG